MKTSDHGIAFVKLWEGVKLKAYQCSANVWTIGVGHTAAMGDPKPVAGMKITEAEAEAILRRDLGSIERDVAKAVTVHLNQRQFDTLVSFVFNVGICAFRKSTLLKIMAGIDTEIEGEAVPMPGLRIGYLPQEPQLDPQETVRQAVEGGMG